MKKVLCIVLTLLMIISLVSCGGKSDEEVTPGTDNTVTEPGNSTEGQQDAGNAGASGNDKKEDDTVVIHDTNNAVDEKGYKIKADKLYYADTDYENFDKRIVDFKRIGDYRWYLTSDGSIYRHQGINNLELKCENTAIKDLTYIEADYNGLFVSDSEGNFILAEKKDNDKDILEVVKSGKLKETQVVISAGIVGDGEVVLDILDTATGKEYDYVTSGSNRSGSVDFNGDGIWLYDESFMAKQYRDGHIKEVVSGWYLDDEGDLYIRDSGSSHMEKAVPEYFSGVKFKHLVGSNDTIFNNRTYVYAVAADNTVYVLRSADSDYKKNQAIRATIPNVEKEIIEATYDFYTKRLVLRFEDGCSYADCDFYEEVDDRVLELKDYEIYTEKNENLVRILENQVLLIDGKMRSVTDY
ncbi:MAG: hypothetical protein MJ171_01230 [Clostridia bacterium]|nr:hypothetical protein [Clostridia bacterium]